MAKHAAVVESKADPRYYAKAIVGLVLAILTALAGIYGDQEWYSVVLAILTAVATYVTPNAILREDVDLAA